MKREKKNMFALEFVEQYCPVTEWYNITTTCFLTRFPNYTNISITIFYQGFFNSK